MNTETYIMTEGGKSYRMLQVGETLEEGDEVKTLRNGWEPYDIKLSLSFGLKDFKIRESNNTDGFLPQGFYRRPIAEHPATDPSNVLPAIMEARL